MNIVQIPRRFVLEEWGGTETVILETSKQLLKSGHPTQILCPNALASSNADIIEGVPVRRTPYFYPYCGLSPATRAQMDRKGGNLFSFQLLHELENMSGLDIIHLHATKRLGGIGRYVARRRGIPYVVTLHGGVCDVPETEEVTRTAPIRGAWEWGKLLGIWVGSRRVLDDAAAIICVGANERTAVVARYPKQNVVYLPNGVDVPRFQQGDGPRFRAQYSIPEHAFVLLTVARIDPQKNQMLAIRALPALIREQPKTHLLLVGPVTNTQYHAQLLAEATRLGISHRVTILPCLSGQTLVDAYHAADIFLLTSRHEPFGIVILEAWAAGLPVVAARVGGIPHFVREGSDALLFDSEDGEGLVNMVLTLERSKGCRKRLQQNASLRVIHEFSWQIITQQLVTVYETVVAKSRN